MSIFDDIENIIDRKNSTEKAYEAAFGTSGASYEKETSKEEKLSWEQRFAILETDIDNVLSKYKDGEQLSLDDKDIVLSLSDRAENLKEENPKESKIQDLGYNLNKMIIDGVKKTEQNLNLDNDLGI